MIEFPGEAARRERIKKRKLAIKAREERAQVRKECDQVRKEPVRREEVTVKQTAYQRRLMSQIF